MCFALCNDSPSRFSALGRPAVVWTISSLHGETDKLLELHNHILKHLKIGDQIVYLGNYTGYHDHAAPIIDEILSFRRMVLAIPGMRPSDFTYLRGAQEEMWQKLLQLQFAPNPGDVLIWMLGNGLSGTLNSYGLSPHDGVEACRQGVMELIKWTHKIRNAIRNHPGHELFNTQLKQAAFTDRASHYPMLFVNSGLDSNKDLGDQGDCLWWASDAFESMTQSYDPFQKVVRGYDPKHKGAHLNCITATIDGNAGFGGAPIAAAFDGESGDVLHMFDT